MIGFYIKRIAGKYSVGASVDVDGKLVSKRLSVPTISELKYVCDALQTWADGAAR